MNNNLLELGGSVDLIATAICDFSTPVKDYKQGDIVLDLKDIYFQSQYVNNQKQARDGAIQLKYSEYMLNSLLFSAVPLNRQIYELFATVRSNTISVVKKEVVTCLQQGTLLPLCNEGAPIQETIRISNVKHFNTNVERGILFLNSDEFVLGQKYELSYEYAKEGMTLELGNKDLDIPYLKLQISLKGNTDKQDSSGYLFVEKAHIMFTPILNFVKDGVSYCTLSMTVIDSEYKPYMVI